MTWRMKAVNPDGRLEWVGPAYPSLGAGLDVLDRIRMGSPADDFERAVLASYGPRWYLSIDHGPEVPDGP